jgi:hypothetical protein
MPEPADWWAFALIFIVWMSLQFCDRVWNPEV